VVNIGLSYYLIIVAGMGMRGVALGTVLAQYFGFLLVLGIVFTRFKQFLPRLPFKRIVAWSQYKQFFLINRDIFIRTICLTVAFGFFYSQSSNYGEVMLGVNVVLMQFLNWMSYGIDGLAYAAESLVGKFKGAKDDYMLTFTIRRVFLWSTLMAIGYAVLYGVFGKVLFRLFTDAGEVIAASGPYILWMAVLPVIGFASYIWDGVFVGLTASRAMRNSMIISLGVYLLAFFVFQNFLAMSALWASLAIFLGARGLAQYWLYRRYGLSLR
jgi:MATE family multidrug resistance protein